MNNQRFTPRKSKAVFTCRHCGKANLTWREHAHGKWVPFDHAVNDYHTCVRGERENLTKYQLTLKLESLGFMRFLTKNSKYQYAYAKQAPKRTVIFLFRKRGIDVKFYSKTQGLVTDELGKLSVINGEPIVNHYYKSEVNLHKLVMHFALCFVSNSRINEEYLKPHGEDWHTQRLKYWKDKGESNTTTIMPFDDGLPDSAFTEAELAAGVQRLIRGGGR